MLDVGIAEHGREDLALLAGPENRQERGRGSTTANIHELDCNSQFVDAANGDRDGGLGDDVASAGRARYGRGPVVAGRENDPFEWRLEVLGDLPMDDGAPLEWLPGNRLVHVASVTDEIVLTHRLTEAERDGDFL